MARQDTMDQTKWRVQVKLDGRVTHESLFSERQKAEDYFSSLFIEGSVKEIQVRFAGKSRFVLYDSSPM